MIYKDDVIDSSNMIDLFSWVIKLKSNNTNQISPFVNSLFAEAIAEYNVPLEWIKNGYADYDFKHNINIFA